MIVMGVDPGTAITGVGVVEGRQGKFTALYYDCIYTSPRLTPSQRLGKIYDQLMDLMERFSPHQIAVEELFFNVNVKTALSVGQARGVVLLAAERNNIEVAEYTPLQVKQAVVGYGRAEKRQVQSMVKKLLALNDVPAVDDASDALAVAICHLNSFKMDSLMKGLG